MGLMLWWWMVEAAVVKVAVSSESCCPKCVGGVGSEADAVYIWVLLVAVVVRLFDCGCGGCG